MKFRDDLDEVIQRTKKFHESTKTGQALIEVGSVAEHDKTLPDQDLTRWTFPADMKPYLSALFDRQKRAWGMRKGLGDDRIPSVNPWYGIAEHSAYVGGEVAFSKDTSYHHPFLEDWDDLAKLELDEDNPWRRMLDDGFDYMKELAQGDCAVSLRGTYSPMEVANAIRGNDLFTDFYESPDEVRALMDFSAKAVAWNVECQKRHVGAFHGGVISGFKSWVPGDSFGQLSEDTSVLTGPAIYEEFGLPYTTRALDAQENLFVHVHSGGESSIPSILKLGKVRMLEVSSDPNTDRGIEVMKRLEAGSEVVGILALTLQEIKANLDYLKTRKTILWFYADTMAEAREAVALVRRELPVA